MIGNTEFFECSYTALAWTQFKSPNSSKTFSAQTFKKSLSFKGAIESLSNSNQHVALNSNHKPCPCPKRKWKVENTEAERHYYDFIMLIARNCTLYNALIPMHLKVIGCIVAPDLNSNQGSNWETSHWPPSSHLFARNLPGSAVPLLTAQMNTPCSKVFSQCMQGNLSLSAACMFSAFS